MKLRITVLPGDGVGPEVTAEAVRVLQTVAEFAGHDFQFQEKPFGGAAYRASGSPLPPDTLDACLQSNAVLLGAVGGPDFDELPRHLRPESGDRKSTRLNSSHPSISYAVFCLKKKKTHTA